MLKGAKSLRLFSLCTKLSIQLFDNKDVKMIMESDFEVVGSRKNKLQRLI